MIFYEIRCDERFKKVELGKSVDWEGIKCPENEGHQRPGKRIGQLEIKLVGKKTGDIIWTIFSECVITDKVRKLFIEHGITGYDTMPVKVCNATLSTQLWELIPTGNGGDAHESSGIYLKEKCDACGLKRYSAYENGIIVDEKNWDGSDIFTIVGYLRHILITEKVRALLIENKIKGITIIPSHFVRWPKGVIKP